MGQSEIKKRAPTTTFSVPIALLPDVRVLVPRPNCCRVGVARCLVALFLVSLAHTARKKMRQHRLHDYRPNGQSSFIKKHMRFSPSFSRAVLFFLVLFIFYEEAKQIDNMGPKREIHSGLVPFILFSLWVLVLLPASGPTHDIQNHGIVKKKREKI